MFLDHDSVLRGFSAIVTALLVSCGGSPARDAPADGAGGKSAAGGGGGASAAGGGAGATGAHTPSDAEIETLAAGYGAMQKMNAAPFVTAQHQGHPLVNVHANALAAATYAGLATAAAGATHFPPGSMLIKEMLDPSGGPPVLTVMYKMPAGYHPGFGDWWRGRLNADGTPTSPDLVGRVGFCVACHEGAASTDHAFGIPGG